jgi:peptidoglycan/LPS O-acetylase OafA/YrhL
MPLAAEMPCEVESSTERVCALDSVRGIAALSVVFHHCLVVFPTFWQVYQRDEVIPSPAIWWVAYTPIHLLWGGLEAVIVFYVLSGFVLAMPLLRSSAPSYAAFTVKRFCRIYLPYAGSLLIAALLLNTTSTFGIRDLSVWFNCAWSRPVEWSTITDHLLMLGTIKWNYVNPVVWSLVHEMRISLIFPALIWIATRVKWQVLIPLAFLGSGSAKLIHHFTALDGVGGSLMETASYLFLFVAGAELAIHRPVLKRRVEQLGVSTRWALLMISILLLNSRWNFFGRSAELRIVLVWIGAIAIVALISTPGPWEPILQYSGLRWLGKISYSLYLVHLVVLFGMLYTLQGRVPKSGIVAMSLLMSLMLAALFHRLVESPSLELGRKLEQRFTRRLVALKTMSQSGAIRQSA